MSDLFLNGNFEVEIGGNGDLRKVSDLDRVKQSIVVHVTAAMYEKIGEALDVEKHLRLAVTRALRSHSLLSETRNVSVSKIRNGSAYQVDVNFEVESFSFEVEG